MVDVLEDIYGDVAASYPDASLGLISYEQDFTIRFFYSSGTAMTDASCVQSTARRLSNAPTSLPAVDTSNVSIYADTESIECSFDQGAYISTTGPFWGLRDEQIVSSAKQKAGALGANAVVVPGLQTQRSGYFGQRGGNSRGRTLAVFERRPCE